MIQRIQSIFLFLSGLSAVSLFGIPFASSDMKTSQFLSDQVYTVQDNVILIVLVSLSALFSFVSIFLFKNRPLQLKLGYFSIIMSVLLIVASIILFYNEASTMAAEANIEEGFGIAMPILAIIFSGLAVRFIRKDDNLVQSMDRLR
jgi:glucan phosphoethanolaminetransferase (alkaline phosphatase superfamily)